MSSKLAKIICLVILIVTVLLTGATPVAAQSMDMSASPAHTCDQAAPQPHATVPPCCVIQDCQFAHSITASLPAANSRIPSGKVIHAVRLAANVPPQSSCGLNAACQQNSPHTIASSPGANCPCRNSLQSEEPPLN
jgi:hypothetical protein